MHGLSGHGGQRVAGGGASPPGVEARPADHERVELPEELEHAVHLKGVLHLRDAEAARLRAPLDHLAVGAVRQPLEPCTQ